MPELPEVETVRRELAPVLVHRRFRAVDIRLPKLLQGSIGTFTRAIVGSQVRSVDRRGKLLLLGLTSGWTLAVHMKMSGQFLWQSSDGRVSGGGHPIPGSLDRLPNRYSHAIFTLSGGRLFFNDQRQFGFLRIIRTDKLDDWLRAQGIGPEALDPTFRFEEFSERLQARHRARIKPVLLDQRFIAGLGNIYADEALFASGIRPTRRAGSLSVSERQRLFRAIRSVLRFSLAKRGTTFHLFRRPEGTIGGMLPYLAVYGRAGQPCRHCGLSIEKIRLGGRGTHYCPRCQPATRQTGVRGVGYRAAARGRVR